MQIKTYEKAPAYVYADARNELVAAVATTFLNDKFYERAEERIYRIIYLITTISTDVSNHPFLWNLVKMTRDEWNLRSVSHLLVVEYLLNKKIRFFKNDKVNPVEIISNHVFIRPDDVSETWKLFITRNGGKNKLPKLLKKATQNWFNNLTEFTASKYIKRLDGITLKDLLKLSHPIPKNDAQNALFKSIIDGSLTSSSDWVTIMTSNKYGDTKTKWLNAIPNMAYLPLLKNLAAMERNEIDPALIIPKLTDPQAIRESRILPFEFVKAFENVTSYQYKNAINTAIELSFNNLTLPQGKYLIAIDTSYSMKGDPLNMAAMFGSVLFNKLKQSADIVVFSTTLTKLEPYGLRVMGLYHHIKRIHQSGSTNAYLVYEYANNEKIPYDFIFMLTDMQYSEHYGLDKIETPTGLIININLQGYDNTQSSNMIKNNVVEIAGFSNKIFDYLEVIKDPQGIINKIISKDL